MSKTLQERLKIAVKSTGGNKKVSEATNIPLGTLNDYLRGLSSPNFEKMSKIASFCNTSLDWLAYGNDSNQATPLNKKVLADAVEVLETALVENDSTLDPKIKAEALILAYEILLEDSTVSNSNKSVEFKSFLKLVS